MLSQLKVLRSYAKLDDTSIAAKKLPPTVYFSHTSHTLTIFDAYPKALFHFLILPRLQTAISTATALPITLNDADECDGDGDGDDGDGDGDKRERRGSDSDSSYEALLLHLHLHHRPTTRKREREGPYASWRTKRRVYEVRSSERCARATVSHGPSGSASTPSPQWNTSTCTSSRPI